MGGQGQRSLIITCLEVCHRLHYRPVLDKYVDRCAPTGWSGRHVDDTTMSNRIRFAVHLDANVHLTPRDQLEAMAVALVADKAGLRVCALGCAVGTVDEAIAFGEVIVLAIPLAAYDALPPEGFKGKIVIDAINYYHERDGHIEALDRGETTTSDVLPSSIR